MKTANFNQVIKQNYNTSLCCTLLVLPCFTYSSVLVAARSSATLARKTSVKDPILPVVKLFVNRVWHNGSILESKANCSLLRKHKMYWNKYK